MGTVKWKRLSCSSELHSTSITALFAHFTITILLFFWPMHVNADLLIFSVFYHDRMQLSLFFLYEAVWLPWDMWPKFVDLTQFCRLCHPNQYCKTTDCPKHFSTSSSDITFRATFQIVDSVILISIASHWLPQSLLLIVNLKIATQFFTHQED